MLLVIPTASLWSRAHDDEDTQKISAPKSLGAETKGTVFRENLLSLYKQLNVQMNFP